MSHDPLCPPQTVRIAHWQYTYKDGYAAALRDAVEAVKSVRDHHPNTWPDMVTKERAVAAIEALGGEQ